jgi:hypothetical protein
MRVAEITEDPMIHSRSTTPFRSFRPLLSAALLAAGAMGFNACQSTSDAPDTATRAAERVDLSNEITASAVVVAVDRAERLITLRRDDGSMFAVRAGPAVRNFDQIAAGDALRLRCQETLTATMLPGGSTAAVEGAFVAGRAKPGEKPAAGAGLAASARVRIESVDTAHHIVVFSQDSGELRAVRAVRPEGREFIAKLRVGDVVQIDSTVSLALSVEEL